MKRVDLSYAVGLLLLSMVVALGGIVAEAHDTSECECACPEPPKCPELTCADGSDPVPKGETAGDGGTPGVGTLSPEQQAVENALRLIEQAEAKMEEGGAR